MPKMIPSLVFMLFSVATFAAESNHRKDVVYGRKYGLALTMDVFKPTVKANGAGVIFVVSGGWFSNPAAISEARAKPFTNRGYTVFQVIHGSQPRFTIPEAIDDLHLATKFIRSKATEYGLNPEKIGITGGSAGGHLSLMMGVSGQMGDTNSKDPVMRQSSGANAVACFFLPLIF